MERERRRPWPGTCRGSDLRSAPGPSAHLTPGHLHSPPGGCGTAAKPTQQVPPPPRHLTSRPPGSCPSSSRGHHLVGLCAVLAPRGGPPRPGWRLTFRGGLFSALRLLVVPTGCAPSLASNILNRPLAAGDVAQASCSPSPQPQPRRLGGSLHRTL